MTLSDIGEFGFIHRISPGCLNRQDRVYKAIGDDAAAYWSDSQKLTLVTTDLLIERVHFLRQASSGFQLGHKALAVNMSDIAAMGGTAREAFVSIAIPRDCSLDFLDELFAGMKHLAREYAVNILGGDTTASRQDLVINIALTGEVDPGEILCRKGARPGDVLCCTGNLGDSRAGLSLIIDDLPVDTEAMHTLFTTHTRPRPHLAEGRFLAESLVVTAAMDISDGLSSDLGHLAAASGVGARIRADCLPLSSELQTFCDRYGHDAVQWALAGGEDYTLLFTVDQGWVQDLQKKFSRTFGTRFSMIGQITDSDRLELVHTSGQVEDIRPTGWNHLRRETESS